MRERKSTIAVPASGLNKAIPKLPSFDGFPYLVTQVVGAFYHIIVLPTELSAEGLREVAVHQVCANRLPTCLVTGPRTCAYFDPDGGHTAATSIPRGGCVVSDGLRPWVDFLETQELLRRKRMLAEFVQERNSGVGYLFGDLTKGGRAATAGELVRVSGHEQTASREAWKNACSAATGEASASIPIPSSRGW